MTDYQFYKTKPDDRWDKIAYMFYGDCFRTKELIEANPDVPIAPVLEASLDLIVPVLEKETESEDKLPAWKQT